MATFNTKKTLYGPAFLIPTIKEHIVDEFTNEGFEVVADELSAGGYDISITKGGLFKAVLGMKSALKVTLLPQKGNIYLEAGIGIWGQQAIPTIISMFVLWPVLITQIWGMVSQAQMDDKVIDIAQEVLMKFRYNHDSLEQESGKEGADLLGMAHKKYCTECGAVNRGDSKFCCECGKPF